MCTGMHSLRYAGFNYLYTTSCEYEMSEDLRIELFDFIFFYVQSSPFALSCALRCLVAPLPPSKVAMSPHTDARAPSGRSSS